MPQLSATEYRLLLEHAPVMVWRAGTDAKCDYFNETWLQFTGRSLAEEMGDGWAVGVHADDLDRCFAYYMEHFNRREGFEMEYRLRRHDGEFRWILDCGTPFTDDSGELAGFIGSCVDIDERHRAQAARERRDHEQLQLAAQFERWVLAIVGHDIRNPLSAIDGAAKVLAMRAKDDPQLRSLGERIERSAGRISNIVTDLLDLSRERHGDGIRLVPVQTDLVAVSREVVDEISSFAKDQTIAVSAEGPANGLWDQHRISQAISNLVGNAVKHGAPSQPIDVSVRCDDASATVEVHNQGAIAASILPTLFQPFVSVGGRNHDRTGLGLGLFIAKAIATAHRGALEVDSSSDRGTTFRLVLPRE